MGCDIAWAAGFLDGEGSFMLSKHGRYRRPKISADNTSLLSLKKLRTAIGGSIALFVMIDYLESY